MTAPVRTPAFREFHRSTPNFTPGLNECLGVVAHHSGMAFEAALDRLTDPESGVSYHALIDADGSRCVFAPDDRITHHAGVSTFCGRNGCNRFMLGLSFSGDTWLAPLTEPQIASALEWLEVRWSRYQWTIEWITDHRQVAPDRKIDLKPEEWERLRRAVVQRFVSTL